MAKSGSPLVDLLVTLSLQILILAGSAQAQNVSFLVSGQFGAGPDPVSVAVGDFNGDGVQDLVVANSGDFDSGNISVLLGNGDGTFQAAVNFGAGNNPSSIAVGDFNGDGVQDLTVAHGFFGSNSVSVLLGNGDGTFQEGVNYGTGFAPSFVAVADFNGDGVQDLAVANEGSDNLSVLLGNGDGTFQAAVNFGAGIFPV